MPLDKGKIEILFRSGMAGDTDERVVPVGAFLDIKNAYVDKKGALVKRNGFQRVPVRKFSAPPGESINIDSSRGLFSTGDELCIPGDRRLYALDNVSGKWNDRGSISPFTGESRAFFSDDARLRRRAFDCSSNGGYRLQAFCYEEAQSTRLRQNKLDVRIDSDDGNVVVERFTFTASPVDPAPLGRAEVKVSFCLDSLLLATWAVDPVSLPNDFYRVHRFVTTDITAPSVELISGAPGGIPVPYADMLGAGGSPSFSFRNVRPDLCGHEGATMDGEFSLRYLTDTFDFRIDRYDNTGALQSTSIYLSEVSSPGVGRWYVDGSISDDPTNDKTLVMLVYYDADPTEDSDIALTIALSSVDPAAGPLWFTAIDVLTPGTEYVQPMVGTGSISRRSPSTMGVSRGAHIDGTEIVAGIYSVMMDADGAEFTVPFGNDTWSSSHFLYDTEPGNHPNYPALVEGAYRMTGAGGIGNRPAHGKWTEIRSAAVDATTGALTNRAKRVRNCELESKPFFDGRHVHAWCITNFNVATGYETAFCLDFRLNENLAAAATPEPYIVAVKDVGVARTTARSVNTQIIDDDSSHIRGAGQSVDRDSLGRVLYAGHTAPSALAYIHGELMMSDAVIAEQDLTANMRESCSATTVTFGAPVIAATLADGATVLTGGNVSWYDSEVVSELGLLGPPMFDQVWSQMNSSQEMQHPLAPEPFDAYWKGISYLPVDIYQGGVHGPPPYATDISVPTYTYMSIWKTYDALGYLHRSVPSPPYEAPPIDPTIAPWNGGFAGNYFSAAPPYLAGPPFPDGDFPRDGIALDCNVMFMKTLPATNREAESATREMVHGVYRDFSNNGLFREINGAYDGSFRTTSVSWGFIVDAGQDLSRKDEALPAPLLNVGKKDPTGELLYTTGGVLETVIPEGAKLAVYAGDRIWLAGFYRAERLAYSKKITPMGANLQKVAPEFNEGFVLTAPAGAAITALGSMDDKIVAFTRDRVYIVAGDGPLPTGANNTFSTLTLVSSDSGCIDPRSVATYPGGITFQSDSGIYVLSRGLSVQFIGEAIRDITKQYPVITSAVPVPDKTQLRFTATTTDGTSGVVIVYDYRVNQWMYWAVKDAGGADVPFVGAAMHRGDYYAVQANGFLWKEDRTTWKDDADSVQYKMSIKTAWLQAAQQSGWQRVYRATALCENKAPMDLKVTVANDFDVATSQVATWTDAVIATFPEPPRMQPMVHIKRQKCQALQLEISDDAPTSGAPTSGEGFTIAGLSLEVGVKRGMVKVSKQQRS